MKVVNNFIRQFGGNWIKVKLYSELPKDMIPTDTGYIKFCDAIEKARQAPVVVDKMKITCLGGRYVFGGDPEVDTKALDVCHYKKDISEELLRTTFNSIPKLRNMNFIGLNTPGSPDMLISYLQPVHAMRILNILDNHKDAVISHFGVAGLCGNVIAKSYVDKKISFFFGCDAMRSEGYLSNNSLIIGVPNEFFKLASK